jgi:hypothetical protein
MSTTILSRKRIRLAYAWVGPIHTALKNVSGQKVRTFCLGHFWRVCVKGQKNF